MREGFLWSSLILFGIALAFFVLTFFVFHYLEQDLKFHKPFKKQPQKPFIANMLGMFGTFMLAGSVILFIIGLVVF